LREKKRKLWPFLRKIKKNILALQKKVALRLNHDTFKRGFEPTNQNEKLFILIHQS
jgi:hypothetical protein